MPQSHRIVRILDRTTGYNLAEMRPIGKVWCDLQKRAHTAIGLWLDLTVSDKIAIPVTPQMAVDNEAISLSRVYSYDAKCTCPYSMRNPP